MASMKKLITGRFMKTGAYLATMWPTLPFEKEIKGTCGMLIFLVFFVARTSMCIFAERILDKNLCISSLATVA
jgi:hypothetical protein